jgi:hypothetical protein
VIPLLLACAVAAGRGQPPRPLQNDRASVPAISVDHVRAALEQPPSKLTLRQRTPDFRINITERERFEITERERFARLVAPILDFKVDPPILPWFPGAPGSSAPLFGMNLLPVAMAAAQGIAALQRAHAKRAARDEVRRTILAYCAAQPDGGRGVQICDSRRAAIR